jgi:large subunit ribosomal protein L15
MRLNELRDNAGARKEAKRVGRGMGSGTGKTAGRGMKGQKARSGVAIKGFEGGQMPIYRRLPRRGFKNPNRADYVGVNLDQIQGAIDAERIDAKASITAEVLKEAGIIRQVRDGIRLLGRGELTAKIDITVAGATKTAVAAVEKAGGKLTATVVKSEKSDSAE